MIRPEDLPWDDSSGPAGLARYIQRVHACFETGMNDADNTIDEFYDAAADIITRNDTQSTKIYRPHAGAHSPLPTRYIDVNTFIQGFQFAINFNGNKQHGTPLYHKDMATEFFGPATDILTALIIIAAFHEYFNTPHGKQKHSCSKLGAAIARATITSSVLHTAPTALYEIKFPTPPTT